MANRFAVSNSPSEGPSVDEAPILHVDLDAFFASVEILDDPSLKGKPVCVGGAGERGVIASASYEARRYGVRSAMPSIVARRVCPKLIILPGRFDRYEEYSAKFHAIVRDLTPDFEPLGLDEVFCDLRSLRRLRVQPLDAARELRQRIESDLHLMCGVGLGRNKLFAKLASKRSKPHVVDGALVDGPGVVWVDEALEKEWLDELPIRALWGVGPATAAKLQKLGLRWVRDLARVDEATLAQHVGPAMAASLAAYAQGEDYREVVVDRAMKSVGHDQTFARSLEGLNEVLEALKVQAAIVARALRSENRVARTITVVVRFDDLTSVSRSQTLPFGVDDEVAIGALAGALVSSVELHHCVRLLAIHASSFLAREQNAMQLSFNLPAASSSEREQAQEISRTRQVSHEALRDAIDEVRRRFGRTALASASELGEEGVDVAVQRGSHAFGPETNNEANKN
jgi:DNA polymerase-4